MEKLLWKINGKELLLKYTYNSFRYMDDFSISDLQKSQTNPTMIFKVMEVLLYGALNHSRKEYFSMDFVLDYLEETLDNTDGKEIFELTEKLMDMLSETSFFKKLQEEAKKAQEQEN